MKGSFSWIVRPVRFHLVRRPWKISPSDWKTVTNSEIRKFWSHKLNQLEISKASRDPLRQWSTKVDWDGLYVVRRAEDF